MTTPKTLTSTFAGLLLGLTLAACAGSPTATTDPASDNAAQAFRGAKDWCDVYTCEPCPSTGCPPGGHEATYCCPERISLGCDASDEVPAGTVCPDGEFLVICNWGQTNVDGTFTCYDTP